MVSFRRTAARLSVIVPLAVLLAVACEHNPAEVGVVASIAVIRDPDTLAVGTARQFTAIGYDADGDEVGINPTWSVGAGGGTIDAAGLFTAGTVLGTFAGTVTATVGSVSGQATVTVIGGPVATITVTPTPVTLATNATQQFTAVGRDAASNVVAIAPDWSVAAGGGTVNSAGLFTSGMAPGTYTNTVKASVGGISGTASVTVTDAALATITVTPNPVTLAIGGVQTFTATGKDASNNVISPLTFTWAVVDATAGSITSAGVFTAGTVAGTYASTVTATSGTITGNATVIVSAGTAASITVTPTPVTLAIGATQQFTAVVRDASNNVLSITPNWSVAASGGTITSTGLFTAGTLAGTYTNTVTASVGSVSGTATVTVSAGALAIIAVTPNPKTLAIGATQTFTAAGRDAYGNPVSVTPAWSVVASGGTINSTTGEFTAGTVAGTFGNSVRACSTTLCAAGSVKGFATVAVNAGALATIAVTPTPITISTGVAQQFAAVGRDANNNIVPILPVWSEVGAGTINAAGLFVAGAAGGVPDSAYATVGSIVGKAIINIVGANPLAAITVTPNPASVIQGGAVTFTATGLDALGGVVAISPAVTWSVVPSVGGGTINSGTGVFTAGALDGTYVNAIQATSGSISGFATVTVTPPLPVGPSLGAAETHGILAGSAVTCAGAPGAVDGDASVWPGSAFTGFPPCTISGQQHAADLYAQTAQGDLTTAYLALAAMACNATISADLGGTTLAEGVYCSAGSVGVTGTLTLTGTATSLFVIRAASTLTTAGNVVMAGGALPQNVYWYVGSSATLGTGSQWQGNILALQSISLAGNVTLIGRALARNAAVSLDGTGNVITLP